MRKILLVVAVTLTSMNLQAQKLEVSAQLYSGGFHYAGNGATETSFVNDAGQPDAYTNNPFGTKNGFSYGGGLQAQYVFRGGFLMGLQFDYELVKSTTDINSYYQPPPPYLYYNINTSSQVPATGTTHLQNQTLNINPYIGYRIKANRVNIDIMPGIGIDPNLSTYDKGTIKESQGNVYTINRKYTDFENDFQLQLAAAAYYKRFGLTAGYAWGLKNYASNMDMVANGANIAPQTITTRFFRFGVSYRIF